MVNLRSITLTFLSEELKAEGPEAIREGDVFLRSSEVERFSDGVDLIQRGYELMDTLPAHFVSAFSRGLKNKTQGMELESARAVGGCQSCVCGYSEFREVFKWHHGMRGLTENGCPG
ncbi:hypothetical protein [Ellagibacter isourolithinifaciens]|uniref:hypothetical protein n=1 Tax=Ellagibacter isourolithinifaciens TaxID=2137581 RepID=UPI003AAC52A4